MKDPREMDVCMRIEEVSSAGRVVEREIPFCQWVATVISCSLASDTRP